MKNDKTITFTITATQEEFESIAQGMEQMEDKTLEQYVADACKTELRSFLSKNEKKNVSDQIKQEADDEIKVAQDQVDGKWDGKILVEIK